MFLSEDLISLLTINKENSVNQAAHIKIINTHFSGSNINTQIFSHIKLCVLLMSSRGWVGMTKTVEPVIFCLHF